MPLHVYSSNRLEKLAQKLAAIIVSDPLPPLQPETVVVQSRGMQRWLQIELSRRNGICANLSCPFPKAFLQQLYRLIFGEPAESPFTPDIMTWKIVGALPGLLDEPDFTSLRGYCADDENGLKLYQLAGRIASVFDNYIVYRPAMVRAWDSGENPVKDSEPAAWQQRLWNVISEPERGMHHAAMCCRLREPLRDDAAVPKRVSIFGIPTLPPSYLDVLEEVAGRVDVHLFYLNPCREFWQYAFTQKEILAITHSGTNAEELYFETGNSLLASLGTSGREFFTLLMNRLESEGDACFEEPGRATMLERIQSDILWMRQPARDDPDNPPLPDSDTSVQVHVCHSPMREVEVLHDNLLRLFEESPGLQPADVVVMMPDITVYAPLIHAVFETSLHDPQRIPYSVADTSLRSRGRIADTLLALLSVDRRRFNAEAVLEILENPAVLETFMLGEGDLVLIREWISRSGIRWGISGEMRAAAGLPPFHENTWRFGLDRLLLSYALPVEDGRRPFEGILPGCDIDADSARVLGAFVRFCEQLFKSAAALQAPRSPAAWCDDLMRVLVDFFTVTESNEAEIQELSGLLTDSGLAGHAARAGFSGPLSRDVIIACLRERIERSTSPHGFLSTGVTFCTMLPMRSIPFRVVCVLGLNEGAFPRLEKKTGFNLMEQRKELGDRSRRNEDRLLFLETMLSARETFVVSYVGRSIRDNASLPPSVLLSELTEYIEASFRVDGAERARDHITRIHPLQPFSSRYFSGDERFFSYSADNRDACAARKRRHTRTFIDTALPADESAAELSLHELYAFYSRPQAYFLRTRLQADMRLDDPLIPEIREPFDFTGLERYGLDQDLLEQAVTGRDLDDYFELVHASGILPHGPLGKTLYRERRIAAETLCASVAEHTGGTRRDPRTARIEYCASGPELVAGFENLYPAGQVFFRSAAIKPKDLLRAWLFHAALCAEVAYAGSKKTILIGTDTAVWFEPLERERACRELAGLIDLFRKGICTPLCFFPGSSYAYAKAVSGNAGRREGLDRARRVWAGSPWSAAERSDLCIRTCFGDEMPAHEAFEQTALQVYAPLLEKMEKP